jgi:hypothetical protein
MEILVELGPSAKRTWVFVSYAQEDAGAAGQIWEFLTEADIPCWMAPRSIPPGVDWSEAIVDAIDRSHILLILLSVSSNASKHVARELKLAMGNLIPAMPVRLEDCLPSKYLKFYLGSIQYLDAYPKCFTEYRDPIIKAVRDLLRLEPIGKEVATSVDGEIPPPPPDPDVSTSSAPSSPESIPEIAAATQTEVSASIETGQAAVQTAAEVVGIDLGHGETAVAKVSVHHDTPPTAITVQGKTSQITALGYHPHRGFVIGDEALLDPDVQTVLTCFKQRPADDPSYQEILADYLQAYYRVLVDSGSIRGDKESYFFVGCPSGWSRDEMSAYESMLKRSGIPRLLVVKESRAALLNVIESGGVTPEELRSTILVVDLGSSTSDFTIVSGGTSEAPMDFGQSLGASQIDGEILRVSLERHPQRPELQRIFQTDPGAKDRCEIRCRKAKEEYFSKENLYRNNDRLVAATFETLDQGVLFVPQVTGRLMNTILNTPLPALGGISWTEMFRRLLTESRSQMRQKGLAPCVIVATGGASRMGFVRPICEEIFPDSKFRRDDEPEVSIARGLARWGRVYLRTADFEHEVDAIADVQIPEIVLDRRDDLLEELSAGLCDGLVETAVRPALIRWRNAKTKTLNGMGARITVGVKRWFAGTEATVLIAQAVERWFGKLEPALVELTDAVCKRYGLPRASLRITPDFRGVWNPQIDTSQTASSISEGIADLVLTAIVVAMGAALLLAGPGGWLVMGTIGAFSAYSEVTEKAKTMNVWKSVRETVLSDQKIQNLLNETKAKMKDAIGNELKSGATMRELAQSVSSQLKYALRERADEARLLIS